MSGQVQVHARTAAEASLGRGDRRLIMIVLGVTLFGLALVSAVILLAQNVDTVQVHYLGRVWDIHMYWLVVAGLVIAVIAIAGLVLIARGGRRYRQMRREHRVLVRDRERLLASRPAEPVVLDNGTATSLVPRGRHHGRLSHPEEAPTSSAEAWAEVEERATHPIGG
jgi:uncharacterized integral membrane protein